MLQVIILLLHFPVSVSFLSMVLGNCTASDEPQICSLYFQLNLCSMFRAMCCHSCPNTGAVCDVFA